MYGVGSPVPGDGDLEYMLLELIVLDIAHSYHIAMTQLVLSLALLDSKSSSGNPDL